MFGRTQLCIYYSNVKYDAYNFKKYLNTKLVRTIAEMTPYKFMYYLPDFELIKNDIDWNKSEDDINKQLYKKCNLSEKEINFIETMIKPME